jgi:hypothetical protein
MGRGRAWRCRGVAGGGERRATGDAPRLARRLARRLRDGSLDSYAPDEIRATVDAPRAGLVVLNEIEFPGWTIEVDGEPAAELRANYLLRAVWVSAGHHQLVWRFAPAWWRTLLAGYALAIAIMAFAGVSALIARARAARRTPA